MSFPGRILYESGNMSAVQSRNYKAVDTGKFYQGCGHVVYKGSFYFQHGGTNRLVK